MAFKSLIETSNYNHEAKKQGWIYKWMIDFISENENILTNENLKEITESSPSLETFDNITPQMRIDKEQLEKTIESLNKVRTQTNMRSM